jgi:hypothetical protein
MSGDFDLAKEFEGFSVGDAIKKGTVKIETARIGEGDVTTEDFTEIMVWHTKFERNVIVNGDVTAHKDLTVNNNITVDKEINANNIKVANDIVFNFAADCAEEFNISSELIEPGSVVVLKHLDLVSPCTSQYDKKVAGVISGAGDHKPGIILDKKKCEEGNLRMPVALMGKVYCKVDADYAPIEIGDLLTTSSTEGHAMKSTDPLKSYGSIIGKALSPLREGKDLIPILVTLQ